MDHGYYGALVSFPNHVEFQFSTMRIDHFWKYTVACFGVEFLLEVDASPFQMFLPIVTYVYQWVVRFYVLL